MLKYNSYTYDLGDAIEPMARPLNEPTMGYHDNECVEKQGTKVFV
jgi:hypothetical protein